MTEDWRREVMPLLTQIEANAETCERAAKRILTRPDHETQAELELDLCRMTLRAALGRIERALARLQGKGE